ncbi:MAG TPA: hypothetical protein VFT46_03140 [Holophagaceae bacterium]|nr:hypothetical protein [Holophagaceae bacterium]
MTKKRRLLLTALAVPALAIPAKAAPRPGDSPQDDPVLRARAARAAAQGIDERDLPPVPKALVEPPPLPPPETHPKDLPGYRARYRHGRRHGKARPRVRSKARPHRAARHK